MDILIFGAGHIGGTLGRAWLQAGHRVRFALRNPADPKYAALQALGDVLIPLASDLPEAEVALVSVPFGQVQTLAAATPALRKPILIDTTNAISDPLPPGLPSAAAALAQWTGNPRVVKAFNATGAGNLEQPHYGELQLETYLCGDNDAAKATVAQLAAEAGMLAVDAGGLEAAVHLEAMARFWVHLAYRRGLGPNIAWKLLRR